MNDVERIRRELTNELKRRGTEITAVLKRQINAAAADAAMLERCRAAMNAGEAIDTDQYFRLRQAEEESRIALLGESARTGPTKIEVELIPAPAQYRKLEDENAALRLQLAAYQSGQNPHSGLTVPAGPPNVLQPVASADSSAAPPAPSAAMLCRSRSRRGTRELRGCDTKLATVRNI